jgi:hypothetical protein
VSNNIDAKLNEILALLEELQAEVASLKTASNHNISPPRCPNNNIGNPLYPTLAFAPARSSVFLREISGFRLITDDKQEYALFRHVIDLLQGGQCETHWLWAVVLYPEEMTKKDKKYVNSFFKNRCRSLTEKIDKSLGLKTGRYFLEGKVGRGEGGYRILQPQNEHIIPPGGFWEEVQAYFGGHLTPKEERNEGIYRAWEVLLRSHNIIQEIFFEKVQEQAPEGEAAILRDLFRENDMPLSPMAHILEASEGGKWTIGDKKRRFLVVKEVDAQDSTYTAYEFNLKCVSAILSIDPSDYFANFWLCKLASQPVGLITWDKNPESLGSKLNQIGLLLLGKPGISHLGITGRVVVTDQNETYVLTEEESKLISSGSTTTYRVHKVDYELTQGHLVRAAIEFMTRTADRYIQAQKEIQRLLGDEQPAAWGVYCDWVDELKRLVEKLPPVQGAVDQLIERILTKRDYIDWAKLLEQRGNPTEQDKEALDKLCEFRSGVAANVDCDPTDEWFQKKFKEFVGVCVNMDLPPANQRKFVKPFAIFLRDK